MRMAENERDLAIGRSVLRQVIVDAQGVLAVVAEILSHGRAGVRGDVEEGGGIGGGRGHHDGVVHGPEVLEGLHDLRDGRALLPDR